MTARPSGRKADELRSCEAKVNVVPNANGSAMFKIGKTVAIAAVYGPKNLHLKFLQNPKEAVLRCNYNMMPFSGSGSDRIRPGGNRRSKEISEVTSQALHKVVNLKKFPGTVIDVFIEIIQADAGTRCAGLCAASMALAEAGLDMLDLPVAVGVGKYKDKLIVDLDYIEDSDEHGVDVPCAILPSTGEITLLQVDGVISKDELMEALTKVKPAAEHIKEIMVKAIKERYEVAGNKK
ncbi:exosome complex exonuclease Rrp41 [Candidatus Woesearchaeota archaeon]|jgi:exosome complex component RRP41|nr:exosome complex exonuclease Rrp41 [Candidatus Woesearchaeota archaeon]MBT4387558.1 exosome complex exonuclease Rrp41 [Candidatus Woesearchaeota archaeon]MBT4595400.1 exosome complex exonuclease Rrp41 [Candidatus Woesearchaeota archaeon]MBT5741195.1 exosome complex exonuclease Rrp41 [Candidatus Woesearchaeota archaeon]MBT6505751.1 exosome complex exonuclease Rrp41 [Candidatus Woesearchaeota archaeon]